VPKRCANLTLPFNEVSFPEHDGEHGVGCEYMLKTTMLEGLGWSRPYLAVR